MSAPFEIESVVRWFDIDANRHMKSTAYMEQAIECRFRYYEAFGFPPAEFDRQNVGPVVVEDVILYAKELHLGDRLRVQFLCGGVNAKGTRYLLVNRILDGAGEMAYELRSMIVWLDLAGRKARTPPDKLAAAVGALARTESYKIL